jgi:citrate synthase
MGFGHRVYKNFDPRARIIKSYAGDVAQQHPSQGRIRQGREATPR